MSARFDWVTSGLDWGPHPVCDRNLLNHPLAAVVPTLGSLVPGWVLVVPRTKALATRDLEPRERRCIFGFAAALQDQVQMFGRHTFVFEHGPTKPRSAIGCGVDQAHLHVLGMNGDLMSAVLADDSVVWTSANVEDPWLQCQHGQDYLLIRDRNTCYIGSPREIQSQYFRKKIAQLRGRPDAWDYREWPCYENAQRTIEHFSSRHRRQAA